MTLIFATELRTLKLCGFDVPPPGVDVKTVIGYVPVVVKSLAGIRAVSCVLPMNVVVLFAPLKRTTDVETKFVPFTVIVNPDSPSVLEFGEIFKVAGTGLLMTNALLVPLTDPPVCVAVIAKVPAFAIVTEWEERIPLANAAVVPPPDRSVPVEEIFTVPVKLVTVLPTLS